MMETLLHLKYDNYILCDYEKAILEHRCKVLLDNLKEQCSNFTKPFEIVKSQNSKIWDLERRVRVTASDARRVSTDGATNSYLFSKLWDKSFTTAAMSYGH